MKSSTGKAIIVVSISLSILFIIFLLNQLVQFSATVSSIHPLAGQSVLVISLTLLVVSVAVPAALFMLLPSPLIAPKDPTEKELKKYLRSYQKRLARNPALIGEKRLALQNGGGEAEVKTRVEDALQELDKVAHERVERFAKRAFYTTAISQNGALDALFMIALQAKMIWDIAHVYNQRPTIKDMSALYTNVMGTALVATHLNDAEYVEMLESSINTAVGSGFSMLPGTTIVINSILNGASNTFLTLRVGVITQRYCNALIRPERTLIRNAAAKEASLRMGGIVATGAMDVFKLMGQGILKKPFSYFTKKK